MRCYKGRHATVYAVLQEMNLYPLDWQDEARRLSTTLGIPVHLTNPANYELQ